MVLSDMKSDGSAAFIVANGCLKACLFIVILIISGCITPNKISVNPAIRTTVVTADVNIGTAPQGVALDVFPELNYPIPGGFGLAELNAAWINQLIDKTRTAAQPIRIAMKDYAFEKVIAGAVRDELKSVKWLSVVSINSMDNIKSVSYVNNYCASQAGAVMLIVARYSFTPDFRAIKIYSDVRLVPRKEEYKKYAFSWHRYDENPLSIENSIYRGKLGVVIKLSSRHGKNEEAIAQWSQNGGSLVRQALSVGVKKLSEMLIADLNGDLPVDKRTSESCETISL
jgi:hypothetical protein